MRFQSAIVGEMPAVGDGAERPELADAAGEPLEPL